MCSGVLHHIDPMEAVLKEKGLMRICLYSKNRDVKSNPIKINIRTRFKDLNIEIREFSMIKSNPD